MARPVPRVEGNRRALNRPKYVLMQVESVQAMRYADRANSFLPTQAAEFNLSMKNEGTEEIRVPVPALWPLGFSVKRDADSRFAEADFSSIKEPESFFTTLKTYEILGLEISVNDYFKDLTASGRFELEWSIERLFANLEQRFPAVKQLPDYEAIRKDLEGPPSAVWVDLVRRDGAYHWAAGRAKGLTFSFFPRVQAGDKVYARIQVSRQPTPVMIELDTANQLLGVQHFVRLALEGFYDRLPFHEIQEDDYIVGGCPFGTGTGAPAMGRLPRVTNDKKIPHVEGTVSFVSRSLRTQGPVRGGEIGSIFVVCFKPHPEWNDEHVPFGKVVSGLEVLRGLRTRTQIESVTIIPGAEYEGPEGAAEGPVIAAADPEIMIKTEKGELRVTLFENFASNTVANFITLIEQGFYDKAEGDAKQTFFEVLENEQGPLGLHTGSPTNDFTGAASYRIPDEINSKECVRGALVMTKAFDPDTGSYVPDSASSQFFICLQDIKYYDLLKAFTVFGQVRSSSFDVLDKLEKGDEIEEVKVITKRSRDYSRFNRAR
ncbi:MAG: peptidylprolyl isomerase [Planctomycetes bacterium]|nr:peptidylprolyl isomerase [Planctomycetota bacterium]